MEVTPLTWIVAVIGLVLIILLGGLQLIAAVRPRSEWTIVNVYGGRPNEGNATAYFAFNRGYALADPFLFAPLQIAASVGMLLGEQWGFLLALAASVPFWYSAIPMLIWDRDMGFRQNTFFYWVIKWGMFPAFGILESVYSFIRLLD